MKRVTVASETITLVNRYFLIHFSAIHATLGRKIALHPKRVVLLCFVMAGSACLGFLNFQSENRIRKLYLPQNTQTEKDLLEAGKYFLGALNSRKETVLLTIKPDYNIFQPICVSEGKTIVSQLLKDSEFQRLCYPRQPSFANVSYYENQPCHLLNPLEIIKNVSNAKDETMHAFQNKAILMSNGKLPGENIDSMFSKKAQGSLLDYKSLKIDLYLEVKDQNREEMEKVLTWEDQFVAKMKQSAISLSCFTVKYSSARSIDDESGEITNRDKSFIFLSFALFLLLSFTATICYKGISIQSLVFGVLSWLSIVLILFSSYGLSVLFSVPFFSMEYPMALLFFTNALQITLWLLEECNGQKDVKLLTAQINTAVRNIGPVITTVLCMNLCAFAVCSASRFPIVRNFCILGVVSTATLYFLCIPILLSLLSLKITKSLTTWKKLQMEGEVLASCYKDRNSLEKMLKKTSMAITRRLLSKVGRHICLLVSIAFFCVGIYGCLQIKTIFLEKDLLQEDTKIYKYLEHYNMNFKSSIRVSLVNSGRLNYSDPTVQQQILNAHSVTVASGKYVSLSDPWISDFLVWNKRTQHNTSLGNSILAFLSLPNSTKYQRDVYLQQSNILASRSEVVMNDLSDQHSRRKAMEELRENLKDQKIPTYAVADEFLILEHSAVIRSEIIKILCLLLVVVCIVPSLVCIYSLVSFLALFTFAAYLTELVGLMGLLGISLNSLTILNLISSVTLVAGQTIYLSNRFALSNENTTKRKLMEALNVFLPMMITTSLILLLAMTVTWFLHNKPLLIYFNLLFASTILGMLTNALLLPVLLISSNSTSSSDITTIVLKKFVRGREDKPEKKDERNEYKSKLNNREKEPFISVVGLSARFPTARTKDEYWQLLVEGRNTLSEYPLQRRSPRSDFMKYFNPSRGVKGRLYVTAGSYLEDIDLFDNNFFGISQSEAEMMDPQQRILIQGVFEAIEDAGLTLQDIQAVNTGVYVGSMNQDYASNINSTDKFDRNQFTGTGTSSAIIANRISFALNLKGPSVTVDTACSSSSTALSFAYEHLKSGKCDIAIVGASNIIVDKHNHMIICQAKMLAPDGQSKAFDARGDGYGRGEGMVVVVLKLNPRSNTRIQNAYCNILACNVNNDGQSAIPITAPSVEGQSRLFQVTCMEAGINPESVSYLEAHGTGTVVGDRVETQSISLAYCANRSLKDPLRVGSVKSNINHTESVAGLAGLAKVCLMIEHKKFVPTVGIVELNMDLDLERRGLKVQQKYEDWPDDPKGQPRTAAVNSFGFGGSNAHMIVQECKESILKSQMHYDNQSFQGDDEEFYVLVLSARTKSALQRQAKFLSDWILDQRIMPSLSLDLCYSLMERRTKHNYRAAMSFQNLKDSALDLQAFSSEEMNADSSQRISSDRVRHSSPMIGFVFGGQGSDLSGLVENLSHYKVLQRYFNLVDSEVKTSCIGPSLLREIRLLNEARGSEYDLRVQESLSDLTRHQLTIFKVQYSIAKLMVEKCGVTPAVALGHSLGDVTAACVSGCISLSNAVDLIIVRAELQNLCREDGKMAAVGISSTEMRVILEKLHLAEKVNIAAINDNSNITLSGDAEGLAKIEAYLTENRETVFWRYLKTAKAYHSHHMSSIEDIFMKYVKKIKFKSQWSSTQFISSVHSKPMSADELSGSYWWQNIRRPVDFLGAVKELFSLDCQVVIEISATPVVQNYLRSISEGFTSETQGRVIDIISALPRAKVNEKVKYLLTHCLGQLFNIGCPVNLGTLMYFAAAKFVRYPTYAWQETKFWHRESHFEEEEEKHLLGELQISQSKQDTVYGAEIDPFTFQFLADHKLRDVGITFPGAGYVEMMLKAVIGSSKAKSLVMENVTFDNILDLSENVVKRLRTTVSETEEQYLSIKVAEVTNNSEVVLSSCRVRVMENQAKGKPLGCLMNSLPHAASPRMSYELRLIQKEAERETTGDEMAKVIADLGIICGETFSLLDKGWWRKKKFLAKLKLPDALVKILPSYVLHPSLIDASLQSAAVAMSLKSKSKSTVPTGIGRLLLWPITKPFCSLYCLVSTSSSKEYNKIQLMTENGDVVLTITDVKSVDLRNLPPKLSLENSMYEVDVVEGSLQNPGLESIQRCKWILIGGKETNNHYLFSEYLRHNAVKEEDLAMIDLEKNCVVEVMTIVKNMTTEECKNIVVNFLPSCLNEKLSAPCDIKKTTKSLFDNCLNEFCNILALENVDVTVEFVTSETVHSSKTNPLNSSEKAGYPIGSLIWGYAKALRMEWPSRCIQCADISQSPSTSEIKLLGAHCINDLDEPEVVIRKNKCYFPRLSRTLTGKNSKNENKLSIEIGLTKPHYLLMFLSEEKATVFEDKEKCIPTTNDVIVRTEFVAELLGRLDPLRVKDIKPGLLSHHPLICYGGTIIDGGQETEKYRKGDQILMFQGGYRLYSQLKVKSTEIAKVPSWMNLNKAVASAGCVVVASRILIAARQYQKGLKQCLITASDETLELAFATMLTAKAAGMEVFTTCTEFDEKMYSAGVIHLSTDDIEEEYRELFDCIICFDNAFSHKIETILFSVRPTGCVFLVGQGNREMRNALLQNMKCTVPCYSYDYSKVPAHNLANEWYSLLSEGIFDENSVFKELLSIHVDICDPYMGQMTSKDEDTIKFTVIKMNKTHCGTAQFSKSCLDYLGFKPKKTYLVVGGHKGLGMETSMWLLDNGADHVITCGRSALSKGLEETYFSVTNKKGVLFEHIACDVTKSDGINKLLARLTELPPLAGIINSAVVYDDRVSQDVDFASFSKVTGPKVLGTILLYEMVRKMDVEFDFFILYSSIASNVGNVGQASYCAGNFFMNEFANRMSLLTGKNFLSVCWGPMGDAGYLSEHEDVAKVITEKLGLHIIPIKTGLQWLKNVLMDHPALSTVILNSFDWTKVGNRGNPLKSVSTVRDLLPKNDNQERNAETGLLDTLMGFSTSEQRWAFLSDYMKTWFAKWLGTAEISEVDLNAPLSQYGIDSGGAMGFQSTIENDYQVTIPLYELLRPDSTGLALIGKILKEIASKESKKGLRDNSSKSSEGSSLSSNDPTIREDEDSQISKQSADEEKELQGLENFCAITHSPPRAQSNFFWVHSTHRFRGNMLAVAEGFKCQENFRIYSIGSEDLYHKASPTEEVNSLARAYTKLISRIQPRGPYFIGGFSYGGLLALEMASILKGRNEKVAMLVMVDTFSWIPLTFANERHFMKYVGREDIINAKVFLGDFLKSVALSQLKIEEKQYNKKFIEYDVVSLVEYLHEVAEARNIGIPNLKLLFEAVNHNIAVTFAAADNWAPAQTLYDGCLLFIEALDKRHTPEVPGLERNSLAWKHLIQPRQFYLHTMDCDHHSIIQQNNGIELGKMVSTMSQLILKHSFPTLFGYNVPHADLYSVQALSEGILAFLETPKRAILGIVKVCYQKRRLKFKAKAELVHDRRHNIYLPLADIVNVIKANIGSTSPQISTMGIVIWARNKKHAFFFKSWVEYNRFVLGLQGLLEITLPVVK